MQVHRGGRVLIPARRGPDPGSVTAAISIPTVARARAAFPRPGPSLFLPPALAVSIHLCFPLLFLAPDPGLKIAPLCDIIPPVTWLYKELLRQSLLPEKMLANRLAAPARPISRLRGDVMVRAWQWA